MTNLKTICNLCSLEEISTQNGPPEKKNLIVEIIKQYLLILEEEKKKTTFLFVFSIYLPVLLLKFRSKELTNTFGQIFP